jgi:effector-binding domain-containing protein
MSFQVDTVTTTATPTAVIRESTTWERFPALWGQLLGEVWQFVRAHGLPAERNVMLYRDEVRDVEVGVELEGPLPAHDRVVASALPSGQAAMTILRGQPTVDGIAGAHEAVGKWCAAQGLAITGVRWEIYGHQRGDPDEIENEIYWELR